MMTTTNQLESLPETTSTRVLTQTAPPALDLKGLDEEAKALSAQKFGQAVRRRRKALKWSQWDLAGAIFSKQSVVSEIEKGVYPLTLDLVLRLSRALNLPPGLLAAAYWDGEAAEFESRSFQALEKIREFITDYFQIGGTVAADPDEDTTTPTTNRPPNTPIPPSNEQAEKGLKEAKEIHAAKKKSERAASKKAGVEPPLIGNGESQDGEKSNPQ